MKIQHPAYQPQVATPSQKTVAPRTSSDVASEGSGAHVEGVKVSVSGKARELAAGAKREDARVEALRKSIEDGTYKVDAKAIASKMVGGDADGDGDTR